MSYSPISESAGSVPATSRPSLGNILVVVHDAASRLTLAQWFESRGHFVALADDQAEAERILETIAFDLIVSDVAATSHRSRQWLENLFVEPPCPTIFLTAHPSLETAIRIANLPLAGYLVKPVDCSVLEQVVSRILTQLARMPRTHS